MMSYVCSTMLSQEVGGGNTVCATLRITMVATALSYMSEFGHSHSPKAC